MLIIKITSKRKLFMNNNVPFRTRNFNALNK